MKNTREPTARQCGCCGNPFAPRPASTDTPLCAGCRSFARELHRALALMRRRAQGISTTGETP